MQPLEALRHEPHISVSSLSTYLKCPRKWRLHYLERAEASHRSIGLVFGHAWHALIGFLLMTHQRGQKLERSVLREYFADALRRELESDGPPILFDDEEDEDALLTIGARMLDAFLDRVPLPDRVLHVELPFRLELFDPETGEALSAPLIGAIDAVVEFSQRQRQEIWELKSGRRRWAQDAVLYDFQPTAYRMALRARTFAERRARPDADLKLIVTTKAKTPDVQIENLVRGDDDERDLAETAAGVMRATRAGCYFPRRTFFCGGCEYAEVCR
ncbi:MAG TPA: PD-(D/E)XK nuclease family protein [Polyangiaceae bacterium]|jgi:hypothetical protein|nr:PD-(D/E)XK nuclease family protein [Polyangiaceae bacterium]